MLNFIRGEYHLFILLLVIIIMALKKAGVLNLNNNVSHLFLLAWLDFIGLLWQQDRLDVWKNTTLSNGYTR